jgi:hypothetical protein
MLNRRQREERVAFRIECLQSPQCELVLEPARGLLTVRRGAPLRVEVPSRAGTGEATIQYFPGGLTVSARAPGPVRVFDDRGHQLVMASSGAWVPAEPAPEPEIGELSPTAPTAAQDVPSTSSRIASLAPNGRRALRRALLSALALVAAGLIVGLIGGYGISNAARGERTVTEVKTVSASSANVPVACRQAIALTRRLKGASRAEWLGMQADFRAAADACELPADCDEALAQGSKLFFEEQKNRNEALAIVRAFEAAAAGCR